MDYSGFVPDDFICDEFFQDWVLHPTPQREAFWTEWLKTHPGKREAVEQARAVLLNIGFPEHLPAEQQVQQALATNLARIRQTAADTPARPRQFSMKRLGRVAAVIAGMLLAGAAVMYYSYRHAVTVVATAYGETRTVVLPDSSVVMLNGHSSIAYATHWKNDRPREVKLDGEAFFNVRHLNDDPGNIKASDRFTVHTGDLDVQVLGTTFDVKKRRGLTEVVLKTGRIRIAFKHKGQPAITLQPGEMIAYDGQTRQLVRSATDPVVQTAWTDKKLILDDVPVRNIIRYIEDNYGYKVILGDTTLADKRMEGTLLLDNLKDVLFIMSATLDIRIEKRDSTLIFISRK